jgi:D-alanyl-D-alanine endopeptidase (penicillin-binding protein 7)
MTLGRLLDRWKAGCSCLVAVMVLAVMPGPAAAQRAGAGSGAVSSPGKAGERADRATQKAQPNAQRARPKSSRAAAKRARSPQRVVAGRDVGQRAVEPAAQAAKRPRRAASAASVRRVAVVPSRPSFGQMAGLHDTPDPLDLRSSVALVVDKDTDQVLFSKNSEAVLPIASITKLMTALVVVEAGLPLEEPLRITQADVDTEKGSRSRLHVGTVLSRGQMLHLALMASENRAAHALGRHYPGGMPAFVEAMNRKAVALGMHRTRYVEPTGLSSANQSSALDLSVLVRAASEHQLIRELSTAEDARVEIGRRELEFRNTNGLVRNPEWNIGLQKTGYISEAGRCVVMQAQLAGRQLIMVLLDSAGRYSRIGDAERLRNWAVASLPTAASTNWSGAPGR